MNLRRSSEENVQKETLTLGDYQRELAEPAISGQNAVIVAPTGSGKTYVSVAVALEVLRKTKGEGKIVFVVNQVPLVHQKSTLFKKYIDKVAYVCGDHGLSASTRLPLEVLLEENSVVVLTAQILVDALVKGQVFLKDIDLIIFDECHETKKDSQYNKVMKKYFELKSTLQENGENFNKSLPQILGMTASFGLGHALKKNEALRYMINICANLDAVRVSTVKRHRKSLADVENKPKDDCHTVRGREKDAFGEEIQDIMIKIIILINKIPGCELFSSTRSALSELLSTSHSCEKFNHKLCRLNVRISEQQDCRLRHRKLKTYTEYLKEYSTALSIHETARTKDALLYLQNFIKKEEEKGSDRTSADLELISLFREREVKLEELSKSPYSKNPGLVKLQELIEGACHSLQGGLANFRGILFTQTIASTKALKSWIMDTPGLQEFNAEELVGSRNPGMSLRHQRDILNKFRDGEHKLLIATFVEQGIDVPACNFVFRYNYISDGEGCLQARGRTRAPGGRFELVVHQERGLEKKDQLGKQQEKVMREATEELSELPEEMLKQKIIAIQGRHLGRKSLAHEHVELNHEFRCQKCRVLVCRSSDIRVIPGGHHVIIAPDFLEKKVVRLSTDRHSPEKREWASVRKSEHELACKDCHIKWGIVLKFREAYILAISVKYFLVIDNDAKSKHYQKWSSLPFTFKEASLEEVAHLEENIS
ncbi:antiviral innate immune response receptor RIG-I-like [Diadema antillarum]|uniref:antiviral innate immune response receptor RIG-I-like n=1 Tax=Diadema antillarum TaxID=105358 RepID=UPI003A8B14BD